MKPFLSLQGSLVELCSCSIVLIHFNYPRLTTGTETPSCKPNNTAFQGPHSPHVPLRLKSAEAPKSLTPFSAQSNMLLFAVWGCPKLVSWGYYGPHKKWAPRADPVSAEVLKDCKGLLRLVGTPKSKSYT